MRRARQLPPMNAGLLVLRIGGGIALGMLFAWGRFPYASVVGISGHSWAVGLVGMCGVLTLCGFATRSAAGLLAAAMAFSGAWGMHVGQRPLEEPVRAAMFAVLYTALALTGPGTLSLEFLMSRAAPARVDAGLLVLRLGAGLSLLGCFGITKIGWVIALLHSPAPLSASGFAQLIRSVGFPAPLLLALCAVLNETVTPLFVASGFLTRVAAAIGALGMAGALYTSLRVGEEPVRAALYVVAFATLALTGAGRYSVDEIIESKPASDAPLASPPPLEARQ
jgi:putative oxidoreductase